MDEYLRAQRVLSKDSNKPVTAEVYEEEAIQDAFFKSNLIRQRLLENRTLDLENAYSQAWFLDLTQKMLLHLSSRILPHLPSVQLLDHLWKSRKLQQSLNAGFVGIYITHEVSLEASNQL